MQEIYYLWILGAFGNAIDYFGTRYCLNHILILKPTTIVLEHELNPIPRLLFKTFGTNKLIPFILIQAFIAAIYFLTPTNGYLLTGMFLAAGFYTLLQTLKMRKKMKVAKIFLNEKIKTVWWD